MQFQHRTRWRVILSSALGATLLVGALAACGGTSSTGGEFSAAKGCTKIGVLLPETNSSPRWEAKDHPLLDAAIKAALPGATIDYNNAAGSADEQQTQAEADLTKGDCILVVAPSDATKAAAIVAKAKSDSVPVISYDRLIQSNDLAYYVSFDNVQVGKLQGQYIADHYQAFANGQAVPNVAIIKGSQTDNNAILFAQGGLSVLNPLFTAGKLKNVFETYTPNWNPPTAESEMEAALTKTSNNIQVVYTANDDMAGTSIQALKAQGLAGKVLVTGQDATVPGLQRILEGTQTMTVYKAIKKEADATASIVAALSKGNSTASLTNGATIKTQGGAMIPSVLETPVAVDKTTVSLVVNDGYVTKSDLCTGLPAGTDSGGIC
ncbi:MAG: sugar ABC transporter substrate-binding protein [Ktedonobacterales bacterium]